MVCFCTASSTFAQHTDEQDAGSGRKNQTDYDAAGRVTQQRTVDAEGKVLEKVEYEYLTGHAAPPPTVIRQTTTTYGADGKVREITRQTFDENTNFTEELIRVFDHHGKQIGGHLLSHDPWKGIYSCQDWTATQQSYKSVECPEGEESSEGAETVKKFTQEEASNALSAARAVVQQGKTTPGRTIPNPAARIPAKNDFGIVLPANVRPGEHISGIVTDDAGQYDQILDVRVTRVTLPAEAAGVQTLAEWNLTVESEPPQPADAPITFITPRSNSDVKITLRHEGDPTHTVSAILHFTKPRTAKIPRSFESAALCMKNQLCMVIGPFSGDSHETSAAFESRPATIVAETQQSAFVAIPEETQPGSRPLFMSEGNKLVALPVTIGDFTIKSNGRELQSGQTLIVSPTLEGPADIPNELWHAGNFPTTNLDEAKRMVPEFKVRREHAYKDRDEDSKGEQESRSDHKNHDYEKATSGEILVVVKNDSPEQISLRGSKNQTLVFHLSAESFKMGTFKFTQVVEALQSGPVNLKSYAIPFLAPVAGQEFELGTTAADPNIADR